MIIDMLMRLGIPTLTTTIYSPLSVAPEQSIKIAQQLPTQIGRIYGMAIYADGVTPDNKALITTSEAALIYLTLKEGMANFLEDLRLDDMLTVFSGAPVTRPVPYLPVNVPNTFDLSTSQYSNPTGIVAGANNKTIALKLWYISIETYNRLLADGTLLKNGELARRG